MSISKFDEPFIETYFEDYFGEFISDIFVNLKKTEESTRADYSLNHKQYKVISRVCQYQSVYKETAAEKTAAER